MLDDSNVRKFQDIYREQFGKEISQDDARKEGEKLLRLVQLVYKQMSLEEYKKLQQRRKETGDN